MTAAAPVPEPERVQNQRGTIAGYDYWTDENGTLFRTPAGALDGAAEFVAFYFDAEEMLERATRSDSPANPSLRRESAIRRVVRVWVDKPPPTTVPARGAGRAEKRVTCRTRLSDREGGRLYVISPRTKMQLTIPFTRYQQLPAGLIERIEQEFQEAVEAQKKVKKPWAEIEYTSGELKVLADLATDKRVVKY